jgi:hypothetical protein
MKGRRSKYGATNRASDDTTSKQPIGPTRTGTLLHIGSAGDLASFLTGRDCRCGLTVGAVRRPAGHLPFSMFEQVRKIAGFGSLEAAMERCNSDSGPQWGVAVYCSLPRRY